MFGLTRREQRWKADQQAAELLVRLATTTINAQAQIAIVIAQSEHNKELAELRAEVTALREKQGGQHEKTSEQELAAWEAFKSRRPA